MIHESYPWKLELLERKKQFLRYNTQRRIKKNDDEVLTVLEKCIFYSAFIIRKLIDSKGKLSDEADQYVIQIEKRVPIKEINQMHKWLEDDTHNWDRINKETARGKDICNWLIHSYIFCFSCDEVGIVNGFFVSSDFDRNKALYFIAMKDWLDYMNFIINDDIVQLEMHYDEQEKDYIFTKKERG